MEKIVFAKTHAEFLNQAFGTNYIKWMSSRWTYDEDTWVWMVEFDGKLRTGWYNQIINENEIWEKYIGDEPPTFTKMPEKKYRIVVQVIKEDSCREYRVLGKFRYDIEKSEAGRHVFIKV